MENLLYIQFQLSRTINRWIISALYCILPRDSKSASAYNLFESNCNCRVVGKMTFHVFVRKSNLYQFVRIWGSTLISLTSKTDFNIFIFGWCEIRVSNISLGEIFIRHSERINFEAFKLNQRMFYEARFYNLCLLHCH